MASTTPPPSSQAAAMYSRAHLSVSPTALSAATYLFDSNNRSHQQTANNSAFPSNTEPYSSSTSWKRQLDDTPRSSNKTRRLDGGVRSTAVYDGSESTRNGWERYRTQGTQWSAGHANVSIPPSSQYNTNQNSQAPPLSQAQMSANKLRTRLRIALYKVQTNQTKTPIACLKLVTAPSRKEVPKVSVHSPVQTRKHISSAVSIPTPPPSSFIKQTSTLSNMSMATERDPTDIEQDTEGEGHEKVHPSSQEPAGDKAERDADRKHALSSPRALVVPQVASTPRPKLNASTSASSAHGATVIDAVTGLKSPPPTCEQTRRSEPGVVGAILESPTRAGKSGVQRDASGRFLEELYAAASVEHGISKRI